MLKTTNELFDVISKLYRKEPMRLSHIDQGFCIAITNTLRFDVDNIAALKKAIEYLFYIDPKHYLILLFLLIPKKDYVPSLKKVTLQIDEFSSLYDKIKYVLDWSVRELNFHRPILSSLLSNDKEKWCKELGVKG